MNDTEKEKMAERFLEVLRDLKNVRKRVQDEAGYGDIDVFKLAELTNTSWMPERKSMRRWRLSLELPNI